MDPRVSASASLPLRPWMTKLKALANLERL